MVEEQERKETAEIKVEQEAIVEKEEVEEESFQGSRCEVFSRIVGYIRPVSQWNEGKAAEFQDRKNFEVA